MRFVSKFWVIIATVVTPNKAISIFALFAPKSENEQISCLIWPNFSNIPPCLIWSNHCGNIWKLCQTTEKYKYGESLSIPPDDLRDALATSISASFKTGNLGDPTEAYTAVLERLCEQLTGKIGENCNAEHCVVHKKFASHVLEHAECPRCGTKQESSQAQWELTRWISAASGRIRQESGFCTDLSLGL